MLHDRSPIRAFRRLLIFSGSFNVLLAAPLAVPWLLGPYLRALSAFNAWLELGGRPVEAPAFGVPALLANTAGIDLVLIGAFVLYAARDPLRRRFIVGANAVGRLLFAVVIAYYVLALDVARIVVAIGSIDVAISLGFIYFLRRLPEPAPLPRRWNAQAS
jgi:ABC-type Fe3+-siderophore transport system permease subunit